MKIGIVTYHRTNNYGACLQAVATRLVLEQMGHEAYYVDYWPKYHASKYSLFSFYKLRKSSWRSRWNYVTGIIKYFSLRKKRIQSFDFFLKEYIYPYCRSTEEEYDIIIYGSDQIWRKQREIKAYNPFYFGKNTLKAKRHIAYAASMGILPSDEKEKDIVKALVSHLDSISVREKDLKSFLEEMGFHHVFLSIDPTLLLDKNDWDNELPTPQFAGEKYVLVYIMGANGFDLQQIQKFAERKHLKVIYLKGYATTRETESNVVSAGPMEFLQLIKNAEYVFSSSFHGVAFSIIYNKQFYASLINNEGRIRSLLSLLGIENRLLPPRGPIPLSSEDIDYAQVTTRLLSEKEASHTFLSKSIGNYL